MPKPIQLIIAQGTSEDREGGLMSLFGILDTISIAPVPPAKPGELVFLVYRPLRGVALWMREDGDDESQEFEHEFHSKVSFHFTKTFFRSVVKIDAPILFQTPGVAHAVSRVRRVGAADWISHDHPIIIELQPDVPSDRSIPFDLGVA
jgi:hypothetical protein